ncbi:ATP-dependent DNA helicase Q4 isoform X2 [Periophthalmus magnuspinnatus]|uniref:ATP-dependent DNA helicase Q4 isoform X2 n=1 Tax=Periophthalmus magnuspinnatus TaxID=409849 RepID=UPI0024367795|nr:ATP-dependent DNA helicase Q4 isoform X2 [Periophthalmus magnuspinnatus]
MYRYNEVKTLLKNWEQDFVKRHQRKPSKEDIDQAPEEIKQLYKEYRSLKQSKENSTNHTSGSADQSTSKQINLTSKEADCWGSHLNRKSLPAASPKLTAQDKDNLKASAHYYGLKLKSNLLALGKERPVSLKKTPTRTQLNTLKEGQTAHTNSPVSTPKSTPCKPSNPFSPSFGSLTSQSVPSEEPEEPFEPFAPSTETTNSTSENEPVPSPVPSIGRKPTLFSSLSPSKRLETTTEALTNYQDGNKVNEKTPLKNSMKELDLNGLKGAPKFSSSFRGEIGGKSTAAKPCLANRLTHIDKKWLERCQVFGELGAQDKPVVGNKEVIFEQKQDQKDEALELKINQSDIEKVYCKDNSSKSKGSADGQEVKLANRDLKSEVNSSEVKPVQHKRKSKVDNEIKEVNMDLEPPGLTPPLTPEEGAKTKSTKRKGRKRHREGEEEDGAVEEQETGAKKKRRRKKKDAAANDNDESPKPAKKQRAKKKGDKDGEEKKEKEPTKPPQENLFGEVDESFGARKLYQPGLNKPRNMKMEGNFVKINLKKKSHVKGYALRGMALRRQMYMEKFQLKGERFGGGAGFFRGRRGGFRGSLSRQGDTCYKCGGTGHWAIDCKGRAPPPSTQDKPSAEEEPFELPTLEEVARATGTLKSEPIVSQSISEESTQDIDEDSKKQDEILLNVIRPDYERPPPPPPMEPLFPLVENGKVQETPAEVFAGLKDLGYQSFRPGQEDAIMRILSGLSTLVVLSTGMGKSLCYQLPAYLYYQRSKCITLVISPLVSLMDDQLSGISPKLKAACIHSNMTMKQREAAIEKVKTGQVCVLLLSPEALVGGGGSGSGCLPPAQDLPPVAFACIDEAHCVSEWSHNFRPCYLRLCKVLRERLGVQCLLGLTATATLSTALDIARHLYINDKDGIAVRSAAVPPNLNLSVSMDREKDQALVSLLRGDRFGCLDSIIVYCTRREETTRVAALLRTCLQGVLVKENPNITNNNEAQRNPVGQKKKELARKKIRKPIKWQAESYHAGLSGSERRRVQNNFMCGELRIVVATVAFGMGLDKSDVRGIIHYNMPKSFESYVQEIGRAGRDGEPAHCHLFLDPEGGDLHELRRHIYADTVDYYTVKRLVQKVFPECKCKQIHQKQQLLTKDIEDSELLEMMEVCEQEKGLIEQITPSMNDQPTDAPQPAPVDSTKLPVEDDATVSEPEARDDKSVQPQEAVGSNVDSESEKERTATFEWPKDRVCHTHERAIPVQQTVETLDITEEGVETLLCYLELHPQRFVELLHPTMSQCKIACYDGPRQLQKLTKVCPPVAVVLARMRMMGERVEVLDQVEFDVVEVADTMGWQLPLVKRGLRQLQWSSVGGRSGVMVEFSAPSFYFRSYGDLSDEEMDQVCHFLHNRVQSQETTQLYQLASCFKAFKSVAYQRVTSCVDDLDESRSLLLKSLLSEYFEKRRDQHNKLAPLEMEELDKFKLFDWEGQIRADIRSFLANRCDEKFTGRAVARILHGIGSPCYPAITYGKDRRYWRKYIQFDFNQLIRLATQEIIQFK